MAKKGNSARSSFENRENVVIWEIWCHSLRFGFLFLGKFDVFLDIDLEELREGK